MSQERMEDLPVNPRIIAVQKAEEQRQRRVAQRKAQAKASPVASNQQPKTQTHAPQLSPAQRRRNQAGQPRETDGKYGTKPQSKWRQFLSAEPAPRTSQGNAKRKPSQVQRRHQSTRKRPASMAAMEHRNPMVKAHWWVTRGFRQWRRRKVRQLRKAFSLRG